MTRGSLSVAALATAAMLTAARSGTAQSIPAPQTADASDIRIFDRYVGQFESPRYTDQESDQDFRYLIEFKWFDEPQTIIKFSISLDFFGDRDGRVIGEGFYAKHPNEDRLFVTGVFSDGRRGLGSVGQFDHETGYRETWVSSLQDDGSWRHIRDTFRILDDNRFENRTLIRTGESGDWQEIYSAVYTRIGVER